MRKSLLLLALAVICVAVMAATPAHADPPHLPFSAHECVYMAHAGIETLNGNSVHVTGQVNENMVYVEAPVDWPDASHSVVLDYVVSLQTLKINWRTPPGSTVMTFVGNGYDGAFVGHGNGHIDLMTGESSGRGIFHGTGDFEGLTMWQDLSPGDLSECPEHPVYGPPFDATQIEGFIAGDG